MSIGDAVTLLRGAILQTAVLSAPVLLVAMVVGLIISIVQATTSIQEQTLTFVPKIAAIFGMIALIGGWMMSTLSTYTLALFDMIPSMVK